MDLPFLSHGLCQRSLADGYGTVFFDSAGWTAAHPSCRYRATMVGGHAPNVAQEIQCGHRGVEGPAVLFRGLGSERPAALGGRHILHRAVAKLNFSSAASRNTPTSDAKSAICACTDLPTAPDTSARYLSLVSFSPADQTNPAPVSV